MTDNSHPSMTKRMIIMLLATGLLLGGIVGYQMFSAAMMAKFFSSNAQPPATVTATEVTRENWQDELDTVGSVRAAQGVQLTSEVPGIVKTLHFRSGDSVDAGALLIELVADEERAELDSLRASRKLAEINLKRDKQQLKINAISQAELDASATELERLRAEEAKQQAVIDRKLIRAPFAGRLGVITLSPGEYINAAVPLVSLTDNTRAFVDFSLPQRYISRVKVGDTVGVHTDNGQGIHAGATISAIDSAVDTNTRNVKVEANVDAGSGLIPGMFVRITVPVGEQQQRLTLPQTAVTYNPYGSTVFMVKPTEGDDAMPVAEQVFVTTGDRRGDQIAILEGIAEGTQVVTSGQMKLKNGTPLIIDNSVTPANDVAPTPQEQ